MHSETLWHRLRKKIFPEKAAPEEAVKNCFWEVDIHSHLVPGIDDGVSSEEEAAECLRQFAEWGIRKVITTPHVSRDWFPNSRDTLLRGKDQLQELTVRHGIPVEIDVAAEYLLDDFFPDLLANKQVLSFGEPRYLLVETAWSSAPLHLTDLIFRIQAAGYTPVLAHPERYKYYQHFEAEISRLRESECLLQLNAMSLMGKYGEQARQQAKVLLKHGWVDFVGSDLHRPADLSRYERIFSVSDFGLLKNQPLRNETLL
ncbi:tyrosine-protein phosphatase [Siphonobacter aquaeclarae]|uniref:protein-tyrosine-phosphatase n=1 Tax=Siphonobacter aquaeclarae TaxID=563176 RepID=A0A1G9V6J1_9BACT|nr:CpsB/CapC family capsule biosynthesis tyrosine phosphatase [Siphonobacter aquaeclarae]SDM67686.1 Tyrosine-protein phosphatase YwqE [Siphonobacter aquaeclarae]